MAASPDHSSFNCELRIIEAKNTKSKSTGMLFVRFFFCAGNNETTLLNSQEIPRTSEPYWDESFSLECSATKDCMEELKQQSVVFELRWRDTTPILGTFRSTKLLGIAEIRWKDVLESSGVAIDTWVTLVTTSSDVLEGFKRPPLHVEMKVRFPETMEMVKERSCECEECGCGHEGCKTDDLFALASLEVL